MLLSDIKQILNATVLWGEDHLDREVMSACGSDFMSDVLAFVKIRHCCSPDWSIPRWCAPRTWWR